MAVPVTQVGILRALLQIERNLTNLQRNMRDNAQNWRSMALAQSVFVDTLAGFMNSAATAYQTRLGWMDTIQLNPEWPRIADLYTRMGGTGQEFTDLMTPLNAVANQLGPAPKTTYAQIVSACDQIIAAINPPLSLWPE
jgi:hypothetical protein